MRQRPERACWLKARILAEASIGSCRAKKAARILGVRGVPRGSLVVLFWGYLAYRILNISHKKELPRSLWVGLKAEAFLSLL